MIDRFLLVSVLAGCANPPLTFGLHRHGSDPVLAFTGVAVGLEVFVTTPGGNARQVVLPSKPHCAVTAPSGAPVACSFSDWEVPSIDEDNGVARLHFTPAEPGWHEARGTLDEGDEELWRVYALERRGEVVARLEHQCGWVDQLRGGAWLCDDLFLRASEPPQSLSAEYTAVAGDFVWAFNTGEVRRFRDSGSGPLMPDPAQRFDTGVFIATGLFASETDAVLQDPSGWTLLEEGSSGSLERTARFERAFAAGTVVRRLGALLLVGEPAGEETEVCVFSISAASINSAGCRRYSGKLLGGADGSGLLLFSGVLRVVNATLDDGVTGELPDLLIFSSPVATRRGLAILPGQIVPRVSGSTLRLESHANALVASEQFVWTPGNVTTVMSR